MKRIDRAREEICERVCQKICAGGDCRREEVEVTVTSRRCIINIPHLKVRVEQRSEEDAVRRVLAELKAVQICTGLGRRSEFADKRVVVRPHPKRGFILFMPEHGIEVVGTNTQRLLDKVMPRLGQMSA